MSYTDSLWVFSLLTLAIVAVPGMDMLFVLTNALTGGRNAGLAATSGIMVGGAYHAAWGTIGVALLLRLAPSLFTVILLAGAAYMTWIGVTLVRSSIAISEFNGGPRRSNWTAFRQGVVSCVLNPKAYVFVLSVYPQFVRPQTGDVWLQTTVFGLITVLIQLAVYGGLAMAVSTARRLIVSRPAVTARIGRAAGLLFVFAGPLTAWHGLASR
jgi:threonine/homoserine/homoserine lactone efflux protein